MRILHITAKSSAATRCKQSSVAAKGYCDSEFNLPKMAKNNIKKHRKSSKNDKKSILLNKINIILCTLVIALIALVIASIFQSKENENVKLDPYILAHADLIKILLDAEKSYYFLLKHPLLSDLIDKKLKPAQDKYGSLVKQTQIYEEMLLKNPGTGGLKNFAEASIKLLDSIVEDVNGPIDIEIEAALNEYDKMLEKKTKLLENGLALQLYINKATVSEPFLMGQLASEGIELEPSEGKNVTKLLSTTSIIELERSLRRLGGFFKDFYPVFDKFKEFRKRNPEMGNMTTQQALENPDKYPEFIALYKLRTDIDMEIVRNKETYQIAIPYINEKSKEMARHKEEMNRMHMRRSLAYYDLKNLLLNEITSLKGRIDKLGIR